MKEITRIHIAKQAYEIELSAKKDLEKYMSKLEVYAGDPEILADIEIRITELLSEHGVTSGGVITDSEVEYLRKTLGEPEEFASDEVVLAEAEASSNRANKRLYRDIDGAVLGGVLSGIAKYMGINPLWARLIFVVLLLVSFGTVLVVYFVLWVALPPARTAAEKLELEGREPTLAAIREMSERTEKLPQRSSTAGRILLVVAGLAAVGLAISALALTIFGGGAALIAVNKTVAVLSHTAPLAWTVLCLLVLSGLLLAALGVLLAYAAFARKFTKKMLIAMVAIIASGLLTFGLGIGMAVNLAYSERNAAEQSMVERKVNLPAEFANVKSLKASAYSLNKSNMHYDMSINYVVDPGVPRYVLRSSDDTRPEIKVEDGKAKIVFKNSIKQNQAYFLGGFSTPSLTIYGPALDELIVEQGNFLYTSEYQNGQKTLRVDTLAATSVQLSGTYQKLEVNNAGYVDADSSTVYDLIVDGSRSGSISAGVVRNLSVSYADACQRLDRVGSSTVSVAGVSSGRMKLNGQDVEASTYESPCISVNVGDGNSSSNFEES